MDDGRNPDRGFAVRFHNARRRRVPLLAPVDRDRPALEPIDAIRLFNRVNFPETSRMSDDKTPIRGMESFRNSNPCVAAIINRDYQAIQMVDRGAAALKAPVMGEMTPIKLCFQPWHLAGMARDLKMVQLLVNKGVDPVPAISDLLLFHMELLKSEDCKDNLDQLFTIGINGKIGLSREELLGQTRQLMRLFLDHGLDVNAEVNGTRLTPLHHLTRNSKIDPLMVRLLMERGAFVNLTDVHSTTPFMDAVRYSNNALHFYETACSLDIQLKLDAENCQGNSALGWAFKCGKFDVVDFFLMTEDDPQSIPTTLGVKRVPKTQMFDVKVKNVLYTRYLISKTGSML